MTQIASLPRKPPAAPAEANLATVERAIEIAIGALKELGIRDDYLVLAGGGPLDERSALAVGADIYWSEAPATLQAAQAAKASKVGR